MRKKPMSLNFINSTAAKICIYFFLIIQIGNFLANETLKNYQKSNSNNFIYNRAQFRP